MTAAILIDRMRAGDPPPGRYGGPPPQMRGPPAGFGAPPGGFGGGGGGGPPPGGFGGGGGPPTPSGFGGNTSGLSEGPQEEYVNDFRSGDVLLLCFGADQPSAH
jgi:hypothetical protein